MPRVLKEYWALALLALVLGIWIAFASGCAGASLRKQVAAYDEVVYRFTHRTMRLCLGEAPTLSKAECLDRHALATKAQTALDVATTAVAGCPAGISCPAGEAAVRAAESLLGQLEGYVFRGN
jgi:hypothetical protein